MKRKFKLLAVAIAAALTIGSITLVSCDKETPLNNSNSETDNSFLGKSSADIPYYPSFDSLYSEINIACSYSNPLDLWKHQNDRGILSIGATSDVLFDELDFDDFSNLNEIVIYYETHTDWLDTCHLEGDKVALFPKWFFSEFRYVANQNGMFAVGNNVFKIFKNGLAYVDALNVEILTSLTENLLASADTSIVHYCIPISTHSHDDHPSCQYGWTQHNSPTDLTDRIHIILKTSKILDKATTTVQVYNLHRGLFVWYPSRHNLSMNAAIEFHTADDQDIWSLYTESKTESDLTLSLRVNVYERLIDNISHQAQNILWFFHNYPDFHHYHSYQITASYPGHSSEIFSYN